MPELSPAARARVDAQVSDVLTRRALSDAEVDALADSISAAVVPDRRPAAAAVSPDGVEPELPDWAHDQVPAGGGGDESALIGGGGAISRPAAPPAGDNVDDDEDELFPLWRPPPRPAVEVPDNVAAITPVTEPATVSPGPESTPPAAPEPAVEKPEPLKAVDGAAPAGLGRFVAVRQRWATLPRGFKIAAGVAGVLSLLVMQQIAMTRRASDRPIAAPPPVVVTPTAESSGPSEGPLQPGCAPNSAPGCLPVTADDCPGGSSDPGLAFGADASQAWICGRAHNIDQQQIVIQFPRPVVVTSICIVPGFAFTDNNGRDHWLEHRLVTAINWNLGGQDAVQQIKPTRDGACWDIPHVATQVIIGTILDSERPPAVNSGGKVLPGILGGPDSAKVDESIAISRIAVNGYPAGAT